MYKIIYYNNFLQINLKFIFVLILKMNSIILLNCCLTEINKINKSRRLKYNKRI